MGRSVPMKLVVWWWFCCVGVAASSERRCESVSSSLNAAFQGGARFDASVESVESYMSRSGLLVIMCTALASWNGSTECDEPMDHLSASFLTNVTGYRVLPSGFGSVVDPLRAKVLCAYPADAATDSRDNRGCGPFSMDPTYGSQRYETASTAERVAMKRQKSKRGTESSAPRPGTTST